MAVKPKHWIICDGKKKPVQCVTGKKAEKAKSEIEHMPGYTMTELQKESCPICFPAPSSQTEERSERMDYTVPEVQERRPGQCYGCDVNRPGQFRLKIISGKLIRVCKECGSAFNVDELKPWKGAV